MGFMQWFRRSGDFHPRQEPKFPGRISTDYLRQILGKSGDFSFRTVYVGERQDLPVTLCFIDGLVSGESIGREVIRAATSAQRFGDVRSPEEAAQRMQHGGVYNFTALRRESMDELVGDLLAGFCALVFDQLGAAICFETRTGDKRSVEQPGVEKAIKGSKDAFVENFRTNTSLLRRKLRDPALHIEESKVGRRSATKVGLVYVDGLTNPELVAQMRARIEKIDIDAVISTGSIEEYVLDGRKSPFPQLYATERPDKMAIGLLEGRVGLLVDGLPNGFLAPGNVSEFFRVPEDNSTYFMVSSLLTLLRYTAILLSILLPAGYVAVTMYHQQMITTEMLLSIIQSRKDVPFSTAAEVLGMLLAFELLQEAGLRLPQTVGQTVSIIGGLVVGQSAVEAKVVSPIVVIIVALSGIMGFTAPNPDMASALRLCRLAAVGLALVMGLYGIILGAVLLLYHLASLENFGVAYMQPFVDGDGRWIARAVLKFPLRNSKRRKFFLQPQDERNQK